MRPTVLLALVLALVVSGCGPLRAEQVVRGEPPIAVDPPAPDQGPIPVEEPAAPERTQVEPDATAVDARPIPWETAQVLDGGDRIQLGYTSGVAPCHVLQRIEVVETDAVVTITLHEGRAPGEGQMCIQIAESKTTVAHLDAPIGTRSLVDGAD